MGSRKRVRMSVPAYLQAQLAELEQLRALRGEEFYQARLLYLQEREAKYQAEREQLRRLAAAYNSASEEERAVPFSQWYMRYMQSQDDGAA